ncbi:MAG: family 10 glycosylhydrolase [Bacteroidota bacterium]|nr:family 10 glycosylhydrolase [Bacteroidota bacterium]MDP4195406.1 family 10 glycosylhydrolase [Bacteroidota bacterium]
MKKNIYFPVLIFSLLIFSSQIFSQSFTKKYEMRGVWIASLGIDWPSTVGTSATAIASQKQELCTIFDAHKKYGLNAMFFHVRPKCDAVYKSNIEPWSVFLTGKDGLAPSDPNYDPLQFAVDEAHKRGMELHAWLNPFRANFTNSDPSEASSMNVINQHPDWVIKCNETQYRFLNPGLPEVRAYVIKVVMDIVRRYNIDGIHFDDYFYPYADYGTYNDDATFNKYKGTFTDRSAWRINNVSLLMHDINDSLKAVKPWVKFGISPHQSPGTNATIYCDPFQWLKGEYVDTLGVAHSGTPYIDYILPQLYGAGYNNMLPTWTSAANGRHLYCGMASYLYSSTSKGFTPKEVGWEIMQNRAVSTVNGGVFYNSSSLTPDNIAGCADSLMHNYFVYPSITPKMNWIAGNNTKPNAPANLKLEKNSSTGKYEFKWTKPSAASDGDTATVYVVYRFKNSPTAADLEDPTNMLGYTGQTILSEDECHFSVTNGNYYVVTAFDRYSNESSMSNIIQANVSDQIPSQVTLTLPVNNDKSQSTFAYLSWTAPSLAKSYQLQVATDSAFTKLTTNYMELRQTRVCVLSVLPNQKYFWRVKAYGIGGSSQYSQVFSFESAIPGFPTGAEPLHRSTNISLNPTLKWLKEDKATSYRIRVGTNSLMTSGIFVDATVTDTFYTLSGLSPNKNYYWQVKSINSMGQSDYFTVMGFKTGTGTDAVDKEESVLIKEYKLDQNYPNPFNPSTKITYAIAKDGNVKISLYNVLGKEIAVLVDKFQQAGQHSFSFDAEKLGSNITSGIYFYTIRSGNYVATKKMMLVK